MELGRGHKMFALTISLIAILVFALSALAWACTAQARVIALTPQAAPVGGQVALEGEGVVPNAPVSIHWNDAAGAKLAETHADANGQFSVAFAVPQAPQDVHFILVVSPGNAGVARMAFEVTSSPASISDSDSSGSGTTDLWDGFSSAVSNYPGDLADGATNSSTPGYLTGAALLSFGALALLAGATLMAVRRRRHYVSR